MNLSSLIREMRDKFFDNFCCDEHTMKFLETALKRLVMSPDEDLETKCFAVMILHEFCVHRDVYANPKCHCIDHNECDESDHLILFLQERWKNHKYNFARVMTCAVDKYISRPDDDCNDQPFIEYWQMVVNHLRPLIPSDSDEESYES